MNILVEIVFGIILGFVGYFGLAHFNINVSFFDYKYSFKKALNQNMKFFLFLSVLFVIATVIESILLGQHVGLAILVLFAILGFVFNLFVFLVLSIWMYLSYKFLKTDDKVFWSVIVFFILFGLIFSLITGKF